MNSGYIFAADPRSAVHVLSKSANPFNSRKTGIRSKKDKILKLLTLGNRSLAINNSVELPKEKSMNLKNV